MAGTDWTTIENALYTWVFNASSIYVTWGAQNQPGNDGPYITMRVGTIATVGLSDSVELRANPSPSPGAEIQFVGRGQRRCILTLSCFAMTPIGANGAAAILDGVLGALSLDPVYTLLSAAGIGISSYKDITSIDGVVGSTLLEPRATVDVVFYVGSELVANGTNIISVQITDQIPTPNDTFTVHS